MKRERLDFVGKKENGKYLDQLKGKPEVSTCKEMKEMVPTGSRNMEKNKIIEKMEKNK